MLSSVLLEESDRDRRATAARRRRFVDTAGMSAQGGFSLLDLFCVSPLWAAARLVVPDTGARRECGQVSTGVNRRSYLREKGLALCNTGAPPVTFIEMSGREDEGLKRDINRRARDSLVVFVA